ncbi:outer membrane protein [Bartonella bovis]|uniref:Porin n=1 Tax=Bartonella bovis 91-4 TaxID=1094491 RepID=N6UIP1_9HYPH|nr:outer membrane protein [Bartonella bovis]ENN92344.1 hemin binding protein [Bartonella bovis 91-4]
MNTKCLISTSIITLFTASAAQAADIIVPQESRPIVSPPSKMSKQVLPPVEMNPNSDAPPVISAPTFSWNGFYLGGQIGGFSGKTSINLYAKKETGTREWTPVEKDKLPQLSGFMGGLYAGANVDLGNSLVLGVDTDIVWSNKQDTKIVARRKSEELEEIEGVEEVEELAERTRRQIEGVQMDSREISVSPAKEEKRVRRSKRSRGETGPAGPTSSISSVAAQEVNIREVRSEEGRQNLEKQSSQQVRKERLQIQEARPLISSAMRVRETKQVQVDEEEIADEVYSNTLKQKWSGATRVRIGFSVDRVMPYIAGGVAYAQIQNTLSKSIEILSKEIPSSSVSDTKMMVGYTLGGGVDFAMADNVILRAEYRYSDFGKQKFAKDELEIDYQTNDFRVGVAYKF